MILAALVLVAVAAQAIGQSYDAGLKAYEAGDYEAAYEAWYPLAKDGDPVAQYSLGKLFERGGGGIEADAIKAAQWYQEAAKQGIAASQNNLALMHAQGRGVERDLSRAIELWLDAAEQNHAMAQYNLGLAYFRGEGLEKNEQEAAAWFRRAADSGLIDAQYAMGQMNRLGLILPKDQGEALYWYRKAADQGHREARSQVDLFEAAGIVAKEPGSPLADPASLASDSEDPSVAEQEQPVSTEPAQMAATSPKTSEPIDQAPVTNEADKGKAEETAPATATPEPEPEELSPAAGAAGSVVTAETEESAEAGENAGPQAPRRKPAVPQLTMQQTAVTQEADDHASGANIALEDMSSDPAADQSTPSSTPSKQERPAKPSALVAQSATDSGQDDKPEADPRRGVQVWLASERSQQAADQLWPVAKKKYPELLAKAQPEIVRVELGDGVVFYRLMVGPLKSRDAARDLCALMRLQDEDAFCKLLP